MYSHTKSSFEKEKAYTNRLCNVSLSLIALIHHGTFFMDIDILDIIFQHICTNKTELEMLKFLTVFAILLLSHFAQPAKFPAVRSFLIMSREIWIGYRGHLQHLN